MLTSLGDISFVEHISKKIILKPLFFFSKFGFRGPFMMDKNNRILSVTRFLPLEYGFASYGIGAKASATLFFGFGIGPKPK